ncbi:hypothetical protein A7U60_g7671 [Sanghuangporus baumii]|uniref:Uncharacterized protein n=1 Tax=Sanghuangporus baumii TaxID=108892 RepID=A0A9Q5HSU4_SANBA|nr:hypothetical protein A7U60_g7671 [Sanghuangporus baumii]
MAVIVPILRLYLLFLNVFETFKTLKPPRRSPRTGEQTPRAVSQRKRDMKGCIAIWLVWCSCAVIEGMADTTVGLVMPFYNEIKGIIYLFQIITRARGAEPIYLHVMRPLVKPYVATLDYALELVHMLGDFITLLISIPFGFIINWWRPSASAPETSSPASESESAVSSPESQVERHELERKPARQASNGNGIGTRTRGIRQASDGATGRDSVSGPSRIARPNGIPQSKSDVTVNQKHKIWRSSANAGLVQDEYDERPSSRRVVSDSATSTIAASAGSSTLPVSTPSEFGEINMIVEEAEEWRQYPPFPSAYPTTPQVRPKAVHVAPITQHQSTLNGIYFAQQNRSQKVAYRRRSSDSAGFWSVARADACESYLGDSGLHDGSGDEFGLTERSLHNNTNNETVVAEAMDVDDDRESHMDIDDDDVDCGDDEDDTLNVTLRTPPRQRMTNNTTLRRHFPSREVSPPPELRAFHLASGEEEEFEDDTEPEAAGLSTLAVPSSRRRANSNYTLSSTRATRTDSQASLTTVSRASSERTISRAPSLASRPSSGSGSAASSGPSSVAGVKRPRPVQDRMEESKTGEKSISGPPAFSSSVDISTKAGSLKGTIRARTSNMRPPVPSRALKPVALNSKPLPKVPRKPAKSVGLNRYDTIESVDEMGLIGSAGETVKRRKVKTAGPAARVGRVPSILTQIPEEKPNARNPV